MINGAVDVKVICFYDQQLTRVSCDPYNDLTFLLCKLKISIPLIFCKLEMFPQNACSESVYVLFVHVA